MNQNTQIPTGVDTPGCQPQLEFDGKLPKSSPMPRAIRDKIIQEFLLGRKTYRMLAEEHQMKVDTVRTMINRYRRENRANFGVFPKISTNMAKKLTKKENQANLEKENAELRRQLQLAKLKLEAYSIMGDILQEDHGIDLLKKSEAKQLQFLKKETQK